MKYLISEAARQVEVESHVLRYWEDELELPIKRNELGHRYYTTQDIERFIQIKNWKRQGLQLKAIRLLLKDGTLTPVEDKMGQIVPIESIRTVQAIEETREQKLQRMAQLFKQTLMQTLEEVNAAQTRELEERQAQEINDAKEHILKEMNYQMQTLAERDEEHYRRLDELLRRKSGRFMEKKHPGEER